MDGAGLVTDEESDRRRKGSDQQRAVKTSGGLAGEWLRKQSGGELKRSWKVENLQQARAKNTRCSSDRGRSVHSVVGGNEA